MSDDVFDKVGWRKPPSKPTPKPGEPSPPPEEDDERSGGAWRNQRKMHLLAFVLEKENGNAPGILYGALIGAPYHDPSRGIQFIFEGHHCRGWDDWVSGTFKVSILGGNLEPIRNQLIAGIRAIIREGGAENDSAGAPTVIDGVIVEPWTPPAKA